MGRLHFYFVAGFLALAGIGLMTYKAMFLGFPLAPDETDDIWVVESHLSMYGGRKPAKISIFVPDQSPSLILGDESFVSPGFGLSSLREDENRRAIWAVRTAAGPVDLYYRTVVRGAPGFGEDDGLPPLSTKKNPQVPPLDTVTGMERKAAESVLKELQEKSSDSQTLVQLLFRHLTESQLSASEKHLFGARPDALKRAKSIQTVLALGGIPSRIVRGVPLEKNDSNVTLKICLEVFYNGAWHLFDPLSGNAVSWKVFLPWYRGEKVPYEGGGVTGLKQRISVQRLQEEAMSGAMHVSKNSHPIIAALSLYRLPVELQSVYRVILTIPIGAFLVVILRNVIGLKTLGTFMPVLIALSFRESEPLIGGIMFSFIVSTALIVRAYFEHLRLLLVPRLASILTVVIIIMLLASLALNQLGFERGLSVALFPMVIMTMVVERMSLLWDEAGARVAIRQGIFTLLISLFIYYVISLRMLVHWLFVFPELLLVVLAMNLLLGRYTGYRLTELYRFRKLAQHE